LLDEVKVFLRKIIGLSWRRAIALTYVNLNVNLNEMHYHENETRNKSEKRNKFIYYIHTFIESTLVFYNIVHVSDLVAIFGFF
jgi:hypothetical protein